jgi:D-tagatose-1,6-bisphosphate aldolase subunit GatZ/KbaZ
MGHKEKAHQQGLSLMEYVLRAVSQKRLSTGIQSTLLAVCPNSDAVITAALRSARRANAPVLFAATLNQVDSDGGYTGLTQAQFVDKIINENHAIGTDGPVIIGLDHGGPWLKDIQAVEKWELDRCMNWIASSLEKAVAAGYHLLHIDPTVDITRPKGQLIPIELVTQRTIDLIVHTEKFRRSRGYPRISYEVGTEEVHGGLADLVTFRTFLRLLKEGLALHGLSDVWPCFVVGKVGTDLHTTTFNPEVAKKLVKEAALYGSVIKGHYTDNVANPEAYPLAGMGGANVGPEFTEAEYDGLQQAVVIEERLARQGIITQVSRFSDILQQAVIDSNRWKKWLLPDEMGLNFQQLTPERKVWLIKTGCRYIWTVKSVIMARHQLYNNLSAHGIAAHETVLEHIERGMDKYFTQFNLKDLNSYL